MPSRSPNQAAVLVVLTAWNDTVPSVTAINAASHSDDTSGQRFDVPDPAGADRRGVDPDTTVRLGESRRPGLDSVE
jgi:hypothetical protein